MDLVVTGSIATDYLMVFPGRFAEQLVEGQLAKVSLSFLVDDLQIRRGGVAANIAYGLGCLGLKSTLVGAVGADFAEYRSWLDAHGVDTKHVRVSEQRHTARFLCTTDADHNQIASFYSGAMDEAGEIDLRPILATRTGTPLVVVSPNDPAAMLRHTRECREDGVAFAADPSQQIPRLSGADLRTLVDGAAYLFTNEYERSLLVEKTGWTDADVLARVGTWITTLGPQGARVESRDGRPMTVSAAAERAKADPTGVGDAFRAGFLAGIAWGLDAQRGAQLGCMQAALVIETVGTQEYLFDQVEFLDRFTEAYGPAAAQAVSPRLQSTVVGRMAAPAKEKV
ncbi:carbohydrate kinase family protein [Actinokineospora sp.]|uniref:carbohydrate kinase family protein n=1 Tax=Actinokineospora sp. TaxID=1872133 RepID=UPI004037D18E